MLNLRKTKKLLKKFTIEIFMMLIAFVIAIINILFTNQVLLNISYSYWASCIFYLVVVLVPKIKNERNYLKTTNAKIELLLRQLRKMFKFALGEVFYHQKLGKDEFYSLCINKKLHSNAGEFHNGTTIYSMKTKDAIYTYYNTFL